jgi:hypothetical protein
MVSLAKGKLDVCGLEIQCLVWKEVYCSFKFFCRFEVFFKTFKFFSGNNYKKTPSFHLKLEILAVKSKNKKIKFRNNVEKFLNK